MGLANRAPGACGTWTVALATVRNGRSMVPCVRRAFQAAPLQPTAKGGVRCLTCQRRWVIPDGDRGWCSTRENGCGTLYTLI